MKRWVHASKDATIVAVSTVSRLAKAEKAVRRFIEETWDRDANGRWNGYNDPNMLGNIIQREYLDLDPNISFSRYVFENRDRIFEDKVINLINDSDFSSEIKAHMIDYFNELEPSDYNRLLYLKRIEEEFKRFGMPMFEWYNLKESQNQ